MKDEMKKIKRMRARTLLVGAAALLALLFAVNAMVTAVCTKRCREDSIDEIHDAIHRIEVNRSMAEDLSAQFDSSAQAQVNTLAILFSLGDQLLSDEGVLRCAQTGGVDELLILSDGGQVRFGAKAVLDADGAQLRYEKDMRMPSFADENALDDLLSGTETFLVNLKTHTTTALHHPLETESDGVRKRYYSKPYSNGSTVVIGQNVIALEKSIENQTSVRAVLDQAVLGEDDFLIAVSEEDQRLVYFQDGPDEHYTGAAASDVGLPAAALENGFSGTVELLGERCFCSTVRMQDGVLILYVVPQEDMAGLRSVIAMLIVAVVGALLLAYTYFLKDDSFRRGALPDKLSLGKNFYIHRTIARKLIPLGLVGVLLISGATAYFQCLHALSEQAVTAQIGIGDIEYFLGENKAKAEALTQDYKDSYLKKAKLLTLLLETNPMLLSCDVSDGAADALHFHDDGSATVAYSGVLQRICDTMHVNSIYVYDEKGQTMCTNAGYWYVPINMTDETAQTYAFSAVLKQHVKEYVQDAMPDDTGTLSQYVGCAYSYADAGAKTHTGLVQIGVRPEMLAQALKTTEIAYQLDNMRIGRYGFYGAVNADDLTVSYSPIYNSIGRLGTDIGFKEECYQSGWDGFANINGYDYYMTCTRIDDHFVYTLMSPSSLYAESYTIALYTGLFSLIFLLVLLCVSIFGRNADDALYTFSEGEKRGGKSIFELIMPSGSVKRVSSAASRWEGERVPWENKTPDQRLLWLLKLLLGVAAVLICCIFIWAGRIFENDSIINYILNGQWDRGVNIFSLTCCAMILIAVVVLGNFAAFVIRAVSVNLGTRTETIGRLVSSVIRFAAVVYGVFHCLMLLGIDAAALLASAGILTLVVGLGAQKLIADFLAGIFIVCEGSFRVGDIVTISGFRGSVLEIGMRTTKIMDASGDIKVFNNSEISGIVNMTKEMSFAACDVGIEYNESLERVELVLRDAFPQIRKRLPAIIEGPFYKGVAELGDSCVVIKIVAKCAESDRVQLVRDLNREIKLLFDKNQINIPFPQIVINTRAEEEMERELTAGQKRRVEKFVNEQKEKSKDIEEEEEN